MFYIKKSIKFLLVDNFLKSIRVAWSLCKVMVPMIIGLKLLEMLGMLEYIAIPLQPIMFLVGLPASYGVAWATALLNTNYAGIFVYLSLLDSYPLTVAQATSFALLLTTAHSVFIEGIISERVGVRMFPQIILRLFASIFIAGSFYWTCYFFDFFSTPIVSESATRIVDNSLRFWILSQAKNLFLIWLIIYVLFMFMHLLDKVGFITVLNKSLYPLFALAGLSKKSVPLAVVGYTVGFTYGSGLLIAEVENDNLSKKDVFSCVTMLSLCHSIIEDTLAFALLTGATFWFLGWRIVFSFLIVAIILFVFLPKLNEKYVEKIPMENTLRGSDLILTYVKNLPNSAGVYRMLDKNDVILYVGKAKDLKKRVISYTKMNLLSPRIANMVEQTHKMEFIYTETEIQALLLEADLIKTLHPKYNIVFRDDKTFSYLAISKDHDYPRIFKMRGNITDKMEAFGPYVSVQDINLSFKTLQETFLIRTCSDYVFKARKRPCLLYQIKRCSAPCVGFINKKDYSDNVKNVLLFLRGKNNELIDNMAIKMRVASDSENYEKALVFRNQIAHLKALQVKQEVRVNILEDIDIVAIYKNENRACISLFSFKNGVNHGTYTFFLSAPEDVSNSYILSQFLVQFFSKKIAPKKIFINDKLDDIETLNKAINSSIIYVDNNYKNDNLLKIMNQVLLNSEKYLEQKQTKNWAEQFEELKKLLNLERLFRIEAYDNTHLNGTNPIGAFIVATPDGFDKSSYRRFLLKDDKIAGNDDYGILKHTLKRRLSRIKDENEEVPDLMIIDGGKGQLHVAEQVLEEMGFSYIPVISIAKGSTRHNRTDKILKNNKEIELQNNTQAFYLIERMRNEVHRFVITAGRAKRLKQAKTSILDAIEGIGKERKNKLLNHFGSAKSIANATLEDLENINGISKKIAEKVYLYFKNNRL